MGGSTLDSASFNYSERILLRKRWLYETVTYCKTDIEMTDIPGCILSCKTFCKKIAKCTGSLPQQRDIVA